MAKQTMGQIICALRKEKGMTQKDLAGEDGQSGRLVLMAGAGLFCLALRQFRE